MKRVYLLVFCLLFAALIFTACGQAEPELPQPSPVPEATPAPAPEPSTTLEARVAALEADAEQAALDRAALTLLLTGEETV